MSDLAPRSISKWLTFVSAFLSGLMIASAQTYGPATWVNDPFSPNANWTVLNANTTSPTYTNSGPVFNGNLFGNSPIGAAITLTNPGDSILLTGQLILVGSANNGNLQIRLGLYFKGTNTSDTGWTGYMLGQPNAAGGGGVYLRTIPNTGIYGSGTGANQPGVSHFLFSAGWGAGTYDVVLSVTRVSATTTLMRWRLTGVAPNVYNYSGRYTNTTAAAQGGFSFDQVGFLSGGSAWGAAGGTMTFSNMLVTVGRFSDGGWTNDVSGNWSDTNNWINGIVANGSGFYADFSTTTLTADRTVTLDSSRTLGRLIFGSASGLNNWILNAGGGSVLTLDSLSPAAPRITVNQNTA